MVDKRKEDFAYTPSDDLPAVIRKVNKACKKFDLEPIPIDEDKKKVVTHSDELEHFGIKGMKWGVRRAEKRAAKRQKKAAKQLAKSQKKWDENASKNWWRAYNNAADQHQPTLDALNEKYKDADFTDKSKAEINKKYVEEYVNSWNSILKQNYTEMFGSRPGDNEAVNRLPFYQDAEEIYTLFKEY